MFFKKKQVADLSFVDTSDLGVYQHLSVERAVDVPYLAEKLQKERYGVKKFRHCPGMSDYANLGYIIPAWCDMEFMANRADVCAYRGVTHSGTRSFEVGPPPVEMGTDIPDGFVSIDSDISFKVFKFESPWQIFCNGEISALLLPPVYHAAWCNNLFFWPGCVSYKKFTIANVMLTVKKQGRTTIRAGEPLIHVIPFNDKAINATVGPATQEQIHYSKGLINRTDNQIYRKLLNAKRFFGFSEDNKK